MIKASVLSLNAVIVLAFSILNCVYAQQTKATLQLRPIQQNGKWGYIDSTGKIIVKPQFVSAEEFSEGLAAIENEDGKHSYVDESGVVVIEPRPER